MSVEQEDSGSGEMRLEDLDDAGHDKSADMIEPRKIEGWNKIGLYTLVSREVGRFLAVYLQTIVAPVITMMLFYTVFLLAFGRIDKVVGDVSFMEFLAPGLIVMAMAQNAFANSSSSIIISKFQGNIVDILMPPLSSLEVFLGYIIGGIARAFFVGVVSVIAVALFFGMPLANPAYILIFGLLASILMAGLGIISGIIADKFDHVAAFTNFFITPLTFLSGTFYSVQALPSFWQGLAYYNPFFYMIDGFRAGFIGQADSSIVAGMIILSLSSAAVCGICYAMLKSGYKLKS